MLYLTVMAGHVQAQCLLCRPSPARMDGVQAELAGLLARLDRQPLQVQRDRGPWFLGAEDGTRLAVPSRLTRWLAGLGIAHQLIPVRRPRRNGAVERFHGAVETSWRGEAGGLDALRRVWNVEKPGMDGAHQPYRGRAGFSLRRVWTLLEGVRVERRVDAQGKCGLWNRPLRVGMRAAGQEVGFDAERRVAVVSDAHGVVLRAVERPWLTADWLWEPLPLTDQTAHSSDTSTIR